MIAANDVSFNTTLCGVVTQDESSHQNRILVVEAHKKKYHLANKSELNTVLNCFLKISIFLFICYNGMIFRQFKNGRGRKSVWEWS